MTARYAHHGKPLLAGVLAIFLSLPGAAMAQGGMGGSSQTPGMPGMGMPAEKPRGGIYPGTMIRHAAVEGYTLMYHLLDMKEREKLMKGMEGMEMPGMSKSPDVTNHLMVFIGDPGGKLVSGTIGFQITGPDGKEQKTMTMGMSGGYGADVIFKQKGIYTIKTKAVIGDKTLLDQITHEVK